MPTKVYFPSNGIKIAALFYSASPNPDEEPVELNPTVIISQPITSVKEQAPHHYAERLALEGFNCLTYDPAYQGESGGYPRNRELPGQRHEDIKSAITYVCSRDDVDPERIGVLGICAGGGYSYYVGFTDARVRALTTINGVCSGAVWREGMDGHTKLKNEDQLMELAAKDRLAYFNGEHPEPLHFLPDTLEDATRMGGIYADLFNYYRVREPHNRAPNFITYESLDSILGYDSFATHRRIHKKPLLMIAGTRAASWSYSERGVNLAHGPRELWPILGATHTDLYDKPEFVDPAARKTAEFFHNYL